jgi:RNA polymerase sigma factor (sigma-70 family)
MGIKNKEGEEKESFDKILENNEKYILKLNDGLSLKEIIIKIQSNKEFIFNFIKQKSIQEIIKSIKNSYRFNRYEIEDIITVVITEYFYQIKIDIINFNETKFLTDFKKEIVNRTQREVYHSYSAKEIPMSDSNFYKDASSDDFQEIIHTKVDLANMVNQFNLKEKQVIKLYYVEGYNQMEIAKLVNFSQQRVSQILIEYKRILKTLDNY